MAIPSMPIRRQDDGRADRRYPVEYEHQVFDSLLHSRQANLPPLATSVRELESGLMA